MDKILEEVNQLFSNLVTSTIHLIPNLLFASGIFVVGFLFSKIFQRLIKRFILYLHTVINNKLGASALSVNLQGAATFISKTFFWGIIIFTLMLATQILGMTILSKWLDGLILYLPNILASVIIIFVGFIVGELISNIVASAATKTSITNGTYLGRFIKYIILFISIIIAIDQIGFDILFLTNLVTLILAVLLFGAALAFGLGAQTSVSNILGSYYVHKNYQVGNTVQLGEIVGIIVKIRSTNVVLETTSGLVSIPSKDFNEEKTTLVKNS